ncbi:MAG: YkgJ family cysteine cluster protein [Bdellovibrionales bacterium]|jgi:Fe-S-cluster containining protein|nr:YkgJ family cysteine cluster protein [Bdellovibrionales bacterium]
MSQKSSAREWYAKGVRFECQGSGKCCVSHGEYGYVYVTAADRKRMAKLRGIPTVEFTRTFCIKEEGLFRLIDGLSDDPKNPGAKPCVFLKKNRCEIYEARPTQCRTWPFWPETMSAKAWKKDVVAFFPGVNKGRVWPREENESLVQEQRLWERDVATGR